MELWKIKGGKALSGSVTVPGAKSALLPILAATLLTGGETELTNCPNLPAIDGMLEVLRELGCTARRQEDVLSVDTRGLILWELPEREDVPAKALLLSALLARCGRARLPVSGQSLLRESEVDIPLFALRALGARIRREEGALLCTAEGGLTGGAVSLPVPDMTATLCAMTAACAARGVTTVINASREPEVSEYQGFLRALGADIDGAGRSIITVRGFAPSGKTGWRVMPDRIHAAALLCACACAGGEAELRGVDPALLASVTEKLESMGCEAAVKSRSVRLKCAKPLTGAGTVITGGYPGVPARVQPLLMAAAAGAAGRTVFVESAAASGFPAAAELARMGADIRVSGTVAVVTGKETLTGCTVLAEDPWSGAGLVLAGLSARGETTLTDCGHIMHEYDGLDRQLRALGAEIDKT